MSQKNKPPLKSNIERRSSFVEYREEGNEGIVEGYAAVFGTEADLGAFVETIERGAFKNAINKSDIRALFNHDSNIILARKRAENDPKSSTMEVWEDEIGLKYRFRLPESQKELRESFSRGDVDQSSFAFTINKDGAEWRTEEGRDKRTIKEGGINLVYDVSPVTYPAYHDTTVALRTLENIKEDQEEQKQQIEETPVDNTWEINYNNRTRKLKLIEAEGL